METMKVTIEPGGWVVFDNPAVRVQFRVADDGRVEPVGIILRDRVLSNRVLQTIPFGRLEAVANAEQIAALVAASFHDGFKSRTQTISGNVVEATYRTIEELGETDPEWSGRHSDEFYRQLAALYRWHAATSEGPSVTIGERLGVPAGRVRRWVLVCREKGYLPAGRAGKEG